MSQLSQVSHIYHSHNHIIICYIEEYKKFLNNDVIQHVYQYIL